jgi:broad specificity phosphatase PhoE
MADVATRVQQFFESSEQELAGRRVLLITHAGTLRMIRYLLEGWTTDETPSRWQTEAVANASFVGYEADKNRLRLRPVTK